jgi:type I restriction enzyme S subunit
VRSGWEEKKLGEFMDFKNGINADKEAYGSGVKFVNVMDIFKKPFLDKDDINGAVDISDKQAKDYSVVKGDILFNRTSETVEEIAYSSVYVGEEPITFGGFVIRGRQTQGLLLPDFAGYCFRSDEIRKELISACQGVVRANIGQKDLNEISILIPPMPEQRKIAAILRTWDEAIEKQECILKKRKQHQKALMLSIFEELIKRKKILTEAEMIFDPVTEKNRSDLPLLAVTQDKGILPRDQLDRRVVMPEGSIDGYKVVQKGDFVISLRSFEGGLEYSEYNGLISPAYTILRPKKEIDSVFYRFYFKSQSFVGRLSPLVFGIRDGKSIAFRDFGFMEIPNPQIDEQRKIARTLLCIEEEMAVQKKCLDLLKKQKRGMMQKLLTGELSVQADKEAA